jgi:nitrogen fixation protein FixH
MKTVGTSRRLSGWHVLLVLVGFFGVIFAVNGVFMYMALSTHTGGESSPYQRGLAYNEIIADAARQDAQGWQASLIYERDAHRLTLDLTDDAGAPLSGLSVDAVAGRPTTSRHDATVDFVERSPGHYEVGLRLEPGQWVVTLAARPRPMDEPSYRLKQRVFVKE